MNNKQEYQNQEIISFYFFILQALSFNILKDIYTFKIHQEF